MVMRLDYDIVQKAIDNGQTRKEVMSIFGITKGQWDSAISRGKLIYHNSTSLERYMSNPNTCLSCKRVIYPDIDNSYGVSRARKKKFCNHSCSAIYNNCNNIKIGNRPGLCIVCKKQLLDHHRKYCSRTCLKLHNEQAYKRYIEEWEKGVESGTTPAGLMSNSISRYIKDKFGNRCVRCGWSEVNLVTGNVPVEIEHIDGDYRNNSESNLTLLCPNCHSLTSTFRSLNKGNGRKFRRN